MIEEQFLSILPDDGAPVLNRIMRLMMARALGRGVSAEEYFSIRDRLLAQGRIGRARGPGGQVYLLRDATGAKRVERDSRATVSEAALMPRLEAYLRGVFQRNLDLPNGSKCIVEDISSRGPRRGRWARPDYIFVSIMNFRFLPERQVDVHAFELKTEEGGDVLAVHEALAQTRFTHFGHLVWCLRERSPHEARLEEVRAQCQNHGVGLILMRRPEEPESFEVHVDPTRKQTAPAVVEGFLESRLTPENQAILIDFVHADRRRDP